MCTPCRTRLRGSDHGSWKGGRTITSDGYVRVWCPDDPRANCGRYMKEHLLVMEEHLGRQLYKNERVHHINTNRQDNRIENLELWATGHPTGGRVSELITWAREILERYDSPV